MDWPSIRLTLQLFAELQDETLPIPKPVKHAKNLGALLRYIDENQQDELAESRTEEAYKRLQQLSKIKFPLHDKLHLV